MAAAQFRLDAWGGHVPARRHRSNRRLSPAIQRRFGLRRLPYALARRQRGLRPARRGPLPSARWQHVARSGVNAPRRARGPPGRAWHAAPAISERLQGRPPSLEVALRRPDRRAAAV